MRVRGAQALAFDRRRGMKIAAELRGWVGRLN
jgi:hypothetical protein